MAETMMGGLGQLGDEAAFGGFGGGADDPYMRQLLRRQAMAAALAKAGAQQQQPMTHWTQVLGSIAQQGVGAWQGRKAEEEALQYARDQKQQEREILANILRQTSGGGGGPAGGFPPAQTEGGAMPAPAPAGGGAIPSAAPGQGGAPAPASANQQDFIAQYAPHAARVAAETGLDPRLILAQSALETGWGRSAPGNNFFGIKGKGQTLPTTEVVNGQSVPQQANFRAYESPDQSFSDYGKFVRENPRYGPVLQAQGLDNQVRAMGASGYATDPQYGQKLMMLARGIQMPEMGGAGGTQVAGPSAPTGAPQEQANVSANTTGPAAPPQAAPAQGGMSRERRIAMAEALVMSGNPNLARIGAMQLQIAKALPENDRELVRIRRANGDEVLVPRSQAAGMVSAPEPDRNLERVVQPNGGEMLVPRSQAAGMTSSPPVSPRPQVLTPELRQQEIDLANARADRSVINTGENTAQSLAQKENQAIQNAGLGAQRRQAMYGDMLQRFGKFDTGPTANIRLSMGQIARDIFGTRTEGLSDAEAGKMVLTRLQTDMSKGRGEGQVSNFERDLFAQALPSMANTPEGLRAAVQAAHAIEQIDVDVAKIFRENARRNPGRLVDPVTVYDDISKYMAERGAHVQGLLQPYLPQQADAGASGGAPVRRPPPQQGAVENGYRFKGGDPSNPGSWERVQ